MCCSVRDTIGIASADGHGSAASTAATSSAAGSSVPSAETVAAVSGMGSVATIDAFGLAGGVIAADRERKSRGGHQPARTGSSRSATNIRRRTPVRGARHPGIAIDAIAGWGHDDSTTGLLESTDSA